jgi:hypothetical protein
MSRSPPCKRTEHVPCGDEGLLWAGTRVVIGSGFGVLSRGQYKEYQGDLFVFSSTPDVKEHPINMKFSIIALLSASALVSAFPVAEPAFDERQAAQSIHDAMVAKGKKYFGTCADPNRLSTGSNSAIIKANFGQVTPENR